MECTYCKSDILDDCHYCPVCGKPTPLSAEASAARLSTQQADSSMPQVIQAEAKAWKVFPTHPDNHSNADSDKVPPVPSSAETLDSKKIHTLLTQANLCRLRRQWEEATDLCIRILRAEPGNQAAHSLLGDIARDEGKNEEAIRWYQLAVDLQPNPTDEAKLRKMEQLQQQASVQERGRRANDGAGAVALAVDGGDVGGTTTLMNISPRRWLKGITITSLLFLIIMLIVLIQVQVARRANDTVPHLASKDNAPVVETGGRPGEPLPPARLGGGAVMPAGERANSAPGTSVGGSGLPPDLRSGAGLASTIPPGTTTPGQQPAFPSQPNLPPASVNSVRPMGPQSTNSPSFAATGNALTGGMLMGAIHDESNDGSATVIIVAQDINGPGMRDHAIRNIIRAARTAFSNNSRLTRATVTIQTNSNAAAGRILMSADVDKSALTQVDPESDTLEALERSMRMH